jgi:hypothetical protein
MKNPIQTFEPNEHGRDFVIGDLHGSLTCFEKLLEGIGFDKTKDRMFSVGDLVDRGPNSLECLELIKEPWFHCVLSNHEQMMLEAFNGGYLGQFWIQNGGFWGYTAYEEWQKLTSEPTDVQPESARLFEMLPLVEQLPFLITVKMLDGKKYHIIHAELPPGETITDETLASPEEVIRLATVQSRDGDFFLWGRFMFALFYGQNLSVNTEKLKRTIAHKYKDSFGTFSEKLSHIISGHTIMQHPITLLGQTNIDTGAYGSYDSAAKAHKALTCIELGTWQFYQATPTVFRSVTPLSINRDDVLKLRPEFAANPGVIP